MSYDYNEISKLYDDVRDADIKSIEFLIDLASLNEKSRVLEIGCGTGNYLSVLELLTKAEVWGIDASEGMLLKAREKTPSAKLIEGDATELAEIPGSYFDLVYMIDVIHHIKDIHTMLKNIHRVLKPNGRVLIYSDSYEHIRNRLTTKYFPETLAAELSRYQDTPELIASLSLNGFKEIKDDVVLIGDDFSMGPRLIEIAKKKGYSMFGLISEDAIREGIKRIEADLEKGDIIYHQRAPYVTALR